VQDVTGSPGALLAVAAGYLIGAIPFGVLVGWAAGVDPRSAGSGRTGATNLLRTVGPAGAVAVLVLDLLKGIGAVLLAAWLYRGVGAGWVAALVGVAAIIGHIRSVFIGFRGGRGVATAAGGLLALSPLALALLAPFVVGAIWRWRYVSLGSIIGALLAPVVTAVLAATGAGRIEAVGYAAAAAILVTLAHADNIGRLRAGTERRLGAKEAVRGDG
jgi:acyl phosphate:glycerol-3-phosphate acyltransferase